MTGNWIGGSEGQQCQPKILQHCCRNCGVWCAVHLILTLQCMHTLFLLVMLIRFAFCVFTYKNLSAFCIRHNANGAMQMAQWRNETLQNACKTNGLYLLTTLYSRQSHNGRVNDVIAHRKFPEKFRQPIFPEKLQPYFWLSSLFCVLIFYARHDGVDCRRTPRRF